MKKTKTLLKLMLLLFAVSWFPALKAQLPLCETFNTGSTGNWMGNTPTVTVTTDTTSPRANGTRYLEVHDGIGSSSVFNTNYNASNVGCGTICFYYKIFDDADSTGSPLIFNTIKISGMVNGQNIEAVFRLTNGITENSNWINICVPIRPIAAGAPLPSTAQGSWQMLGGATNAQWNQLVANYAMVSFFVDVAGSSVIEEVIGIDNFCVTRTACCDPSPTPFFTIQTACNNGVVTVTLTANDTYALTNHTWALMQTRVCGSTTDANTVDADPSSPDVLDPVAFIQGGTTATFTISDLSKCFYIEHFITQPGCSIDRRTRLAVPLFNATNIFNMEDSNGVHKKEFCYGENIFLDGTASQGENAYYIDVWRRPIGNSGAFTWYSGPGWATGQVGVVNLSQQLAGQTPPVYFQPGYQYQVKLALQNLQNCIGWTEKLDTFTVICCENYINGCFHINTAWKENTYSLTAVNFNTYTYTGAVHEWYVMSSPNPSGGPFTPVTSLTTTMQNPVLLYDEALPGLYYFVWHRIKTPCGDICTQVIQYQTYARTKTDAETGGCEKIDCAIIDSLWPSCPAPGNLVGDCEKNALTWDVVAGASSYVVDISYNDPACCRTTLFGMSARYEVTTNYLNLNSIVTPAYDCFSWKVSAKCGENKSDFSRSQCFSCKGGTIGRVPSTQPGKEDAKIMLQPVIAPNPNSGTMTLYLKAPGDLTITVDVYSATGKRVQTLKQRTVPGGQFSQTLTLPPNEKGMYTVVFKTNYGIYSKKVVVQ